MLTIFPSCDESFNKEILNKFEVKGAEQELLIAKENDRMLGYIAFDIEKYKLYVLDIFIDNSLKRDRQEIIDSMIKAASSFAINRKVFILCSENRSLFDILEFFGFKKFKNIVQLDLYNVLGKCNKCCNNMG